MTSKRPLKSPGNHADRLRSKAERRVEDGEAGLRGPATGELLDRLYQELQVYQVESEMQNDDLRQANEALEIQQLKFLGIYELGPVGYFILDSYGIIEDVNTAALDMLGEQRHRLLQSRLQSFLPSSDSDIFYRFLLRMKQTGERQRCQIQLLKHGGQSFSVRLEGILVPGIPRDAPKCYLAVIDITEEVDAAERLEAVRRRLELALAASQAGTWEFDIDTGHFILDGFVLNICEMEVPDFDGSYAAFMKFIHPADRAGVESQFRSAIARHTSIAIECRLSRPGSELCYVAITGGHVPDLHARQKMIGTFSDVTSRKILENEAGGLRLNQEKLVAQATIQAQENERQRISGALHDGVSQLLYGLRIHLQRLGLERANADYGRLYTLIDQAIEETRTISFQLAPSMLRDFGLAPSIAEMIKRLSSAGLLITATVSGIRERFSAVTEISVFRMVQELVNNSMKHGNPSEISIAISKRIQKIHITVADNGTGFHPTTDGAASGMGLQSIRHRLSLFDGTLQITPNGKRGTRMKIIMNAG